VAGVGLSLGLAASFAVVKSLSTFLYGVAASHTLSCVVGVLVPLASALGASAIPAYRAARIDPVKALRG
jgi:ABC-type antimicrobial peptide transport system permease subunit